MNYKLKFNQIYYKLYLFYSKKVINYLNIKIFNFKTLHFV